jgi:murein DD-endopeptidase MepM/ murein hydrolase activator NlpD
MIAHMSRIPRPFPKLWTGTAVAMVAALALLPFAAAAQPVARWTWPLDPVPRVVRAFERPSTPYGQGHRGVDLAGAVGQRVVAVADGRVSFAGSVAGRGVVVVDHGVVSSTYQPVSPFITRGDRVFAGQTLGSLELTGSHCLPDACLHVGAKRGDRYLDPLGLLPDRPVRLKPLGGLRQDGQTLRGWPPGQIVRWPRSGRAVERPGAMDRPGAGTGLGAGDQRGAGDQLGAGASGATAGLVVGGGRIPPKPCRAGAQARGWACR